MVLIGIPVKFTEGRAELVNSYGSWPANSKPVNQGIIKKNDPYVP